ncbi:MAG: rRNA ((1939)-C(5))-methyltransferase RlmD [Cyanobacteriota bacterium]|jgi:23S rRNA (uracil1939-C5)-methyltransferase
MADRVATIGQVLELDIDGLGHDGRGVGRWRETVVFVPGALPGERVSVRVRRLARRHLEADLIGVDRASEERCRPACILADRCGGCSLQHCAPAAQMRFKSDQVHQALRRIGQLEAVVEPIWGTDEPLGYRNRALIPLERTGEGVLRAGYYRRGSHRIVNMNRCPVLDPRIEGLIAPLKADLEASGWPVDVNLTAGGGLRHLGLRVGHHSGEVLITLISSHDRLPGLETLAEQWRRRWPQVVGVGLNLQPKASNVVLGAETRCIHGRPWLRERFAGIDLQIAADTFFQVNTPQAERLVPLLAEFLQPGPETPLLDAYCGIGTFSLPLAAAGSPVLGLEVHAGSVAQAAAAAERHGLAAARFEQADVAAVLADRLTGMAGLLVDPPRKGLSEETLAAIERGLPPRIAYISCNPATLARDLGQLCGSGRYRLRRVQPVDFFPQTSHVECLALLERL